MKSDSLEVRIPHGIADLRGTHPRIRACRASLENWYEGAGARHSLWLDIRWPQHQSIVSGPACASPDEALRAGFDAAARRLADAPA